MNAQADLASINRYSNTLNGLRRRIQDTAHASQSHDIVGDYLSDFLRRGNSLDKLKHQLEKYFRRVNSKPTKRFMHKLNGIHRFD